MTEAKTKVRSIVETNKGFATNNKEFKAACEVVEIPASARQASKWRRKTGLAYSKGRFG
jgi:hypothetical protein